MIFPNPEKYIVWACSCFFQIRTSIPELPLCYFGHFHTILTIAQTPKVIIKIRLVIIYRTPYSSSHPVMVSTFMDEFADYLESTVLSTEPLLITSDINIHVDVSDNADAVKFRDLLESMALTQHVRTPTHGSHFGFNNNS